MLEEKNDNLLNADGNTTDSMESTPAASSNDVVTTLSEPVEETTDYYRSYS
jgi:hypothetical protein